MKIVFVIKRVGWNDIFNNIIIDGYLVIGNLCKI